MAYTATGRHPLLWSPEAEIDLLRSICLRGMLQPSRASPLGKVRDVRWRVITAEMRGWGWGFSLRSLKLQWEASLQPRLDEILSEGLLHIPIGSTREQRIALLTGPQLAQIDGIHNDLPKPPEPTPFDGTEDETAAAPQASAANPGGLQQTEEEVAFYRDKVPPENLGMTMGIQNALLAKFRQFTVDEMLGARALMADILDAANRACEAAVFKSLHPGPAYHLRHQLHYIHLAWCQVMDGYRPLTERQYEGIKACEVVEAHLQQQHCQNNQRLREWQLRGWLQSVPGQQAGLPGLQPYAQSGLQQQYSYNVPPPPPKPSSPRLSPFKLGTEEMPLGSGYSAGYYQAPLPGGTVQRPVPVKRKKQQKAGASKEDDDGFWDETESDTAKKRTKKRAKKEAKKPEEQAKEQEEKREKQNQDRQERAARRLRRKEGLE
ncbi:hypothetical protein PG991_007090 [Apiospora marii]|uniref:Uncharacterized protein n=1 Tax=Apiospora marii TaxID=335849 RepID=A0ABR1S1B8_9PEZI